MSARIVSVSASYPDGDVDHRVLITDWPLALLAAYLRAGMAEEGWVLDEIVLVDLGPAEPEPVDCECLDCILAALDALSDDCICSGCLDDLHPYPAP